MVSGIDIELEAMCIDRKGGQEEEEKVGKREISGRVRG